MRFLVTLLALLSLVGSSEALDLRVGGVTMAVAGTCITLTPSTGLGAVTIATCQDLSTTGSPTFAGETLTGQLILADGTASAGAITFTDQRSMGIYKTVAGGSANMGFAVANGLQMFIDSGQISPLNGVVFGWASAFNQSPNVNFSRVSNGVLQLGTTAANASGTLNLTSLSALSTVVLGGTAFGSLPADSNGTFRFCSDCDPPTLVDSTCASVGAKTGSLAFRVNGVWKCIS